ncbi:MAG: hypothetical protein Q8K31_06170 [Burkholderiaceae bacterium]|nr:hypothetical protein [Burkholderiaceae bacterium]MDO9090175.1 hypothetical protein [Burkholderiaceae bacterium]MDP1968754.1 hypothetical protein [Burkholderiaceae bacterium]
MSHHSRPIFSLSVIASTFLCGALNAGLAQAADKTRADSAQTRYRQQVAYCNSGQSQQDKATCLREAGAALQDDRRGRLADSPTTLYRQNALARCDAQPLMDREACVARMQEPGAAQGSVKAGGLIRETVTPVDAPAK